MGGPRTEKTRACATFVKWSQQVEDEDVTYVVHLVTPYDPRLVRDFGYACDCREFRTRAGPCVHVLIAKGHHCGWHQAYDVGEKIGDDLACPRCGGQTVVITWTPSYR